MAKKPKNQQSENVNAVSGTTLEACKNLGRNCFGVDIDKKWVEYCRKYY